MWKTIATLILSCKNVSNLLNYRLQSLPEGLTDHLSVYLSISQVHHLVLFKVHVLWSCYFNRKRLGRYQENARAQYINQRLQTVKVRLPIPQTVDHNTGFPKLFQLPFLLQTKSVI